MAEHIDGPLYYETMGKSGPVMAFVHPNPMDQSCWIFQIAAIVASKSGWAGMSISTGLRCSFFAWRNRTRPSRTCCGPKRTASSRRPVVWNIKANARRLGC